MITQKDRVVVVLLTAVQETHPQQVQFKVITVAVTKVEAVVLLQLGTHQHQLVDQVVTVEQMQFQEHRLLIQVAVAVADIFQVQAAVAEELAAAELVVLEQVLVVLELMD